MSNLDTKIRLKDASGRGLSKEDFTTSHKNMVNSLTALSVMNVTITNGYYVQYDGQIISSASKCYTLFGVVPGDIIKVTTVIGGAALYLAYYKDSNGNIIGKEKQGVNGVTETLIDYQLTIPANTTSVLVNGVSASSIVVKKLQSRVDSLEGILTDTVVLSPTIVNGSYIFYDGSIVSSATRCYTSFNASC